jgi:uncharacterized repeat protein (TIGR02543 family)
LTVSTGGSGSVTRSPNQATYADGTVVTLTASPASGWTFTGWSGALTGSNNPTTITMNGNKAVTATFTQSQGSVFQDGYESGSFSAGPAPAHIQARISSPHSHSGTSPRFTSMAHREHAATRP